MTGPNYTESNLESARIILADPTRYGGPESALCLWARRYLARVERETIRRDYPLLERAIQKESV